MAPSALAAGAPSTSPPAIAALGPWHLSTTLPGRASDEKSTARTAPSPVSNLLVHEAGMQVQLAPNRALRIEAEGQSVPSRAGAKLGLCP